MDASIVCRSTASSSGGARHCEPCPLTTSIQTKNVPRTDHSHFSLLTSSLTRYPPTLEEEGKSANGQSRRETVTQSHGPRTGSPAAEQVTDWGRT